MVFKKGYIMTEEHREKLSKSRLKGIEEGRIKAWNKKKISQEEINKVIDLYTNKHKGLVEISNLEKYSRGIITQILLENNVKIRINGCPKGQVSTKKGKTYEEIYGKERAKEITKKMIKPHISYNYNSKNKGKTLFDLYGLKKAEEIREKIKRSSIGRKHSEETKLRLSESRKGEKSHFWKGGISPLSNKRVSSIEWIKISSEIRQRDNNTCQNLDCGKIGGNIKLPVHHIIPFNISHCNESFNLITLCRKCHRIFEAKVKILGYKMLQERLSERYGYQYNNSQIIINLNTTEGKK